MSNNLFPVPISFHIFNRPETTLKVFEKIRNIKPSKLFITADGPRKNVEGDNEKCREVRSIVDEIDWECEVFTNFSESNKGSYKSTLEGITWVFEHVALAIILEDDCIPHQSFFRFCHELLYFYENDERIALISGNNFLFGKHKMPNYKKKNGHFVAIFTNQQVKIKEGFIHFPKAVNISPMKTSVSKPKQVRIIPQATCFVVEVVYEKEVQKVETLPDSFVSIDLGLNNIRGSSFLKKNLNLECYVF